MPPEVGNISPNVEAKRRGPVGNRATLAVGVASICALVLVGILYPLGIQYLTDLGECTGACLSQAQQSARTAGLLVLLPFLLMGVLLTWGASPDNRMSRTAPWVVLLGGYAAFFPVVYWAGP